MTNTYEGILKGLEVGGDSKELDAFAPSNSEHQLHDKKGRIKYGGEGETLADGCNRCIHYGEGNERYYSNMFKFGTSKCGRCTSPLPD